MKFFNRFFEFMGNIPEEVREAVRKAGYTVGSFLRIETYFYGQLLDLRRRFGFQDLKASYASRDLIANDFAVVSHGNGSYAVFFPSQIKFVEPLTYDDVGKPTPLFERFNRSNPDEG